MVWSPVNHIPHRDVAVPTQFLLLSTANGTELTISSAHIVYVSDTASGMRTPVAVRDVKVSCYGMHAAKPGSGLHAMCVHT